jgi:hypothetical protein
LISVIDDYNESVRYGDVVCVEFNEGEESGYIGSEGFIENDVVKCSK